MLYLEIVLKIISIVLPLLIAIAYFTLAERKIMAAIQRRKGPNVVGFLGLLQPLADGLKLILKETTIPSNANKILFNIAPILTFFLSLLGWAVIPFGNGIVLSDINLGLMYIFAISSLGVYGVIIAGWSSNSKYAFLGALRSAAQMISYELSMGFIIINIVILTGSFNLSDIITSQDYIWYAVPQLPMFFMFFVCCLAETNRHPFDLMEAEAELVSGFNVEYAAVGFAMFFLGEYGNILLMCGLTSILFLGGWQAPISFLTFIPGPIWFGIKIACFVVLFIWVRAAYPRYRYDQLMRLGWKIFLPLSLGYLIFTTGIHTSFFSTVKNFTQLTNVDFAGNYLYLVDRYNSMLNEANTYAEAKSLHYIISSQTGQQLDPVLLRMLFWKASPVHEVLGLIREYSVNYDKCFDDSLKFVYLDCFYNFKDNPIAVSIAKELHSFYTYDYLNQLISRVHVDLNTLKLSYLNLPNMEEVKNLIWNDPASSYARYNHLFNSNKIWNEHICPDLKPELPYNLEATYTSIRNKIANL